MGYIELTEKLYTADLVQAIIMTVISAGLFGAIFYAYKGENSLLKGAILPVLVIAGLYGVFGVAQIINYNKKQQAMTAAYEANPGETLLNAKAKAEGQIKGYQSVIQREWPIMLAVGLLLLLLAPIAWLKGGGLGLIVFAILALLGDYALQVRMESYLHDIEALIALRK